MARVASAISRCSLPRALAVACIALAAMTTACDSTETDGTTTSYDIEALPGLGPTQQQMLDVIFDVQAEIQRAIPRTEPWQWLRQYTIAPCAEPLTGQGQALFFPNLLSEASLTPAEWEVVFPIIERVAAAAGLTNYHSPKSDADFRVVGFSSTDGRTLQVIAGDSVGLSATISCRRVSGLEILPGGHIEMPPNPQ